VSNIRKIRVRGHAHGQTICGVKSLQKSLLEIIPTEQSVEILVRKMLEKAVYNKNN